MPTINSSKLIKARIDFMTKFRVPPTMSPEEISTPSHKTNSPTEMREGREIFSSDRRSLLRELSDMYSASPSESIESLVARMATRDREMVLGQ